MLLGPIEDLVKSFPGGVGFVEGYHMYIYMYVHIYISIYILYFLCVCVGVFFGGPPGLCPLTRLAPVS